MCKLLSRTPVPPSVNGLLRDVQQALVGNKSGSASAKATGLTPLLYHRKHAGSPSKMEKKEVQTQGTHTHTPVSTETHSKITDLEAVQSPGRSGEWGHRMVAVMFRNRISLTVLTGPLRRLAFLVDRDQEESALQPWLTTLCSWGQIFKFFFLELRY